MYRLSVYSVVVREPTYYILTTLLDGPLHGYGIIKRTEELSDGRIRLAAGTLYGALDRLLDEKQVEVDGEEQVNGRLRRYYRLTDVGRASLVAEVTRMKAAIAAAGPRLATARPVPST
jgi:DNA-binding PadR family transcriptional regulator